MAKNTKLSIAFYERYLMTVDEAAVYFHIGYKKMRSLIKDYPGRNGSCIAGAGL